MNSASESIERDLRSIIKGDLEFDRVSRQLYATDAGLNQIEPLGVVSPRDVEDVARLVAYAAARRLPLVARGMGSGLAGGAVGAGLQVDFTRYMNRILEVAPDGSWARVQPGVVMAELNQLVKSRGVFFAPDPSSENYCSLGGMISTNSSGARTVAYGGTKDHVLALDVVLADGTIFNARSLPWEGPELHDLLAASAGAGQAFAAILPELRAKREAISSALPRVVKNCSGYRVELLLDEGASGSETVHLQKLFVGAEGTLGLVTEATLRLVPLPQLRGIAMAYFPSVFASGEAVPGILSLAPTAVEIMDSRFLALVRKHDSHIDATLPPRTDTALLIEFEGNDEAELGEKFAALGRHLDGTACLQWVRPADAAQTERLWTVRKSAVALALRMPGPRRALPFIEDVTVHPTEVPRYVDFLQKVFDRRGVDAVMYGHVGDGNIHTRPLLDPKDAADLRTIQGIFDEVADYVLGIRGTMSGEHGDGLLRSPYIQQMYGAETYAIFERVKEAFDPLAIMNPGKKVVPQETSGPQLRDLRYGTGYRTLAQQPVLHFPSGGYEADIERCHGCGQCKSIVVTTMCPTYKATRREHASPRAKANLLRGIITGSLDPKTTYGLEVTKTVDDYCIVCGMCAVECPSNVNIPKLMLEAKSRYRGVHRAKADELILGHAETVSRLGRATSPLANRLANRPGLRRIAQPFTAIDRRRPLAPFARRTFAEMAVARDRSAARLPRSYAEQRVERETGSTPEPVAAYFYDLFANYNDPSLALAVQAVLQAHGMRVVLPEQRASGLPEMLYGYAASARKVAEFNIHAFVPHIERGATLIASEPTASFAFKVHYPDYVSDAACSLVANATRDLGEFLARRRADHPEIGPQPGSLRSLWGSASSTSLGNAERPAPLLIGYHQPCHLKAQQVGSPSLALLREIPGVEVVDLAAGCCGMAGTFGMRAGTYELSMLAGKPLFDRIAALAPHLVASECSTCRMQLAHATGFAVIHPILLLADAYGLGAPGARPASDR